MITRKTDQNSQADSGLARRDFLTAAAAIAVGAHAAVAQDKAASPKGRTRYGKNADPVRYPDPDIVVLGGGMSNAEQIYRELPGRLSSYVFGGECDTSIVKAAHGDSSGVRGAAWLATI